MSKFVDSIIGHAVGDAMGVPVEFCIRERLLNNPVTKMIGYGTHNMPAGTWSDDTSMEIATIDSFINKGCFDSRDIMNNFYLWVKDAKYTAGDVMFDIGHTCLQAINDYSHGCDADKCGADDMYSNGNGSLMRILPVALYAYYKNIPEEEIVKLTNRISALTHAHEISKLGCYIYVRYVMLLLSGIDKYEAYNELKKVNYDYYSKESLEVYNRILKDDISKFTIDDIKSSGYVVDSLEAALWVLLNGKNYEETIIGAINLGNDTDTIAAIAGSMAGIIYGVDAIPKEWLDTLIRKDYLVKLALDFEKSICNLIKDPLVGTMVGDIAGSRFELVNNKYGKKFELLVSKCRYTDDTVMTLAVAKALLDYKDLSKTLVDSMVEVGRNHSSCGFGGKFYTWITGENHEPYGSFGNGAAMRISPVGVVAKDIDEVKELSAIVTNVSHNHPDSIKGAEAVAVVVYLALHGESMDSIKEYISKNYFDSLEVDGDSRYFHINCIDTVKQSLDAFFRSFDFEDAIRNAIALGGDSDTIAAITGSMAAAYYGIPEDIYNKTLEYLDDDLKNIHSKFIKKLKINCK